MWWINQWAVTTWTHHLVRCPASNNILLSDTHTHSDSVTTPDSSCSFSNHLSWADFSICNLQWPQRTKHNTRKKVTSREVKLNSKGSHLFLITWSVYFQRCGISSSQSRSLKKNSIICVASSLSETKAEHIINVCCLCRELIHPDTSHH